MIDLEVHDQLVSRIIEQRLRVQGAEKCSQCGHFILDMLFLFEAIDELEELRRKKFDELVKSIHS